MVQRTAGIHALMEFASPEPVRVLGMAETRFGRPRLLPMVPLMMAGFVETGFVAITLRRVAETGCGHRLILFGFLSQNIEDGERWPR